jgi:hypothetical protein
MKLAIVGSRGFTDYPLLLKTVQTHFCDYEHFKDMFEPRFTEVVSGGAIGADKMGEQIAAEFAVKATVFKPDWDTHGKAAGFIRNEDIIKNSDFVLACWDGVSRGTGNSLSIAKRLKKPTLIIYF